MDRAEYKDPQQGDWHLLEAQDVDQLFDEIVFRLIDFRCPSCKGLLVYHSGGGVPKHFEHYNAWAGCPHSSAWDGRSNKVNPFKQE